MIALSPARAPRRPPPYDAVARALCRAREPEDFGLTAFHALMDGLVEDIADAFATDPGFDRELFCRQSAGRAAPNVR